MGELRRALVLEALLGEDKRGVNREGKYCITLGVPLQQAMGVIIEGVSPKDYRKHRESVLRLYHDQQEKFRFIHWGYPSNA